MSGAENLVMLASQASGPRSYHNGEDDDLLETGALAQLIKLFVAAEDLHLSAPLRADLNSLRTQVRMAQDCS